MSTLAEQTVLDGWRRVGDMTAECQVCEWNESWNSDRKNLYQARRHAVATGHDVDLTKSVQNIVSVAGGIEE